MTTTKKPDNWDDLEDGTRDDALVDEETERHYIVHDGMKYWFDIKEPTWHKRTALVGDALDITDEGADLKLDEYYLDMLDHIIEDMSVDGSVRTFLIGMDSGLGAKLQEIAPDPEQGMSEDEEKKSGEPSEVPETDEQTTQA